MFMNKSGTPRRNKKRLSVKVTAQNSEHIQQWIGKDERISKYVNDVIEVNLREKERDKKVSDYKKMLESGSFHKIEQLKKAIDNLLTQQDSADKRIIHVEKRGELLEELVSLFKWSYVEGKNIKTARKKIWRDIYAVSKKLQKHGKK